MNPQYIPVIYTSIVVSAIWIAIYLGQRRNIQALLLNEYKSKSDSFARLCSPYFSPPNLPRPEVDLSTSRLLGDVEDVLCVDYKQASGERNINGKVAIAEASVTGIQMLQQFAAVDQNFYRAISALAGKQLTGFADLHNHVAPYASSLLAGMSDNVVNKVQGHVAEQIVADHLRHLGHHVTLAAHSNQPGYDLIVDHHLLINVKNHFSMAGINAHFTHYPDIPVIAPDHIASAHHGLLHIDASHGIDQLAHALPAPHTIISDHGLNHHHVLRQTHHALNAAAGHVPMHLPWIAIGTSTWREAKLLCEGATKLERAAKNILCDTAGTGIGGAIGAKVGGAVGTVVMPVIGTAVGALAGGIIGGIAGRNVSNQIKYAPLKKLQAAHSCALDQLKATINDAQKRADANYEREKLIASEELQKSKIRAKNLIDDLEKNCLDATQVLCQLTESQKNELIWTVDSALSKEENSAKDMLRQAKQAAIWKRLLLIEQKMLHAKVWLRLIEERKRNFHRSLEVIDRAQLDASIKTAALFDLTLALGYGREECHGFLKQLKEQSDKYRSVALAKSEHICSELRELRVTKMLWLATTADRLIAASQEEVKPHLEAFKPVDNELKAAMKSFGFQA